MIHKSKIRRSGPRAFTLIELLVVVTIIVVLISMLMPAVEQAMTAAQRAKCLANIHVQYSSLLQYATDNGGWFFPSKNVAESPDYYQIQIGQTGQAVPGNPPNNSVIKMRPYLPNGQATLCPILAHLSPTWSDPTIRYGGFGGWNAPGDDIHITTPYMWLPGFTLTNDAAPTMVKGEPEPPLNLGQSSARQAFITHRIDYFLWSGQVLMHDWSHFGAGSGQPGTPYDNYKSPEMPLGTGDGSAFLRQRAEMDVRMVIGGTDPNPYPNFANPGFPGAYIW